MDLLTVKETAEILRVSQITVRRYIASGKLAAERVGGGIRVRREAIEDFVTPVVAEHAPFYWPHRPPNYAEEDLVEIYSRSSPSGVVWVLVDRLDEYLDKHENDGTPFGDIVGIGRSGEPTNIAEHKDEYVADAILAPNMDEEDAGPDEMLGRPFTMDDPLWDIVGIGKSDDVEDVARNKYKYVAEAIMADKFPE